MLRHGPRIARDGKGGNDADAGIGRLDRRHERGDDRAMTYRPLFIEALRRIEQAGRLAAAEGSRLPIIIVGGAAVEFYTAGDIMSGDIDLCETDERLEAALLAVGFERETRPGRLLRGLHLTTPLGEIGVEAVSGPLFHNRTDRRRLKVFAVDGGAEAILAMPPIEDLIADRLAQYEANPSGHDDMLEQARILVDLADQLDLEYLGKRVREECVAVDFVLRALNDRGSSTADGRPIRHD